LKEDLLSSPAQPGQKIKKNCNNLLARGKSCGRLAPVCVPRISILEFWFGAFAVKAEK
jgi:hypothetical protein